MKAEHRHELKTNELADWMAHFPQWAKQNIASIAVVLTVIILAVVFYAWKNYHSRAISKEHIRFTGLLIKVSDDINKVLQAHSQGKDMSFILLQADESLQTFASTKQNNKMAAFALIKRAEALRAELHYRMASIPQQDINEQIGKAEDSYNKAIEKAQGDPMLTSIAQYGLGLCAEEKGDYENAKKIYQGIIDNPEFEPLVTYPRAKNRLVIMDEFKEKITFRPAPASAKPSQVTLPDTIKLPGTEPLDINSLKDSNTPAVETKVLPPIEIPIKADEEETPAVVPAETNEPAPAIVPTETNEPAPVVAPAETNEPSPVTAPTDVNSVPSTPQEAEKENPAQETAPEDTTPSDTNDAATAPDPNATG